MDQLYKLFFRFIKNKDPEQVHHFISSILNKFPEVGSFPSFKVDPKNHTSVSLPYSKLTLKNPYMLAAGFDKEGVNVDFFNQLGIGGMEVGTITVQPQPGNPTPRIWRQHQELSLNNAMGFPSNGMHVAKINLKNLTYPKKDFLLGINIGKNKETPNEQAWKEYSILLDYFKDQADYFTVNISSPNTAGLRDLFLPENFKNFINKFSSKKPIFLKISPDLENKQMLEVIKTSIQHNSSIKGFILNNTSAKLAKQGGYSGPKLYPMLLEKIKTLHQEYKGNYPFDLIACGGLSKKEQLQELRELKVNAFQFYTAFVYQGPGFFKSLN